MPKKVLIVDDDPSAVAFLEEILQDHDIETTSAYNCMDGLDKAKSEQPDLILLDMEMPDKGGTSFYINLRRDDTIRETPVIVVSGVGPRPPALRKGVPTISKPVAPDLLMEAVSERLQ